MKFQSRLVLPVLLLAAFITSCSDPCSIPMERSPRLRILNAMADQQQVNIFINGSLVQQDLKYNPPITYTPSINQGYITTFASGAPLPIGSNQKLVVLSSAGDTLLKQVIALSDRRQTMILIGRGHQRFGASPTPANALMLDDQLSSPADGKTIARYVHAMPDLDTLDVYFSNSAAGKQPNLKIGYGQVTEYRELPAGVDGLLVTAGGDTSNTIMRINQAFGLTGLFGTVVIRGSTEPQGNEPLPSPVVLSDRELGPAIFSITSIFVRFVNGASTQKFTLLAKGPIDQGPWPRGDINGQEKVYCIPPDSATPYWSITKTFHGEATWFFRKSCDFDTVFAHSFKASLNDLTRYTFAALQTSKLGVSPETYDHLMILDTMGSPRGSTHGRVRFVNLSPDVTVTIETPTGSRTLAQREIVYVDYPVGTKSFVTNGKTVSINVAADDPKTVWFGAATASDALPYTVSED
jgi:hypothetical protein